jgi:hypothetical protein
MPIIGSSQACRQTQPFTREATSIETTGTLAPDAKKRPGELAERLRGQRVNSDQKTQPPAREDLTHRLWSQSCADVTDSPTCAQT